LVDAVSASWGTHIVPVRPELIISTDDTTEYIFEGTKDVAPKLVLATKSSILKRGTNAIYRPEDSKAMNGMRVKLTFSFTAGVCAYERIANRTTGATSALHAPRWAQRGVCAYKRIANRTTKRALVVLYNNKMYARALSDPRAKALRGVRA
jgi:hypothetical protein